MTAVAPGSAGSTSLDAIRGCFEGAAPSLLSSCAADGTPNLTYVSQVHYVDREHVALTYQFFSKTRENILANPQATVFTVDIDSGARYLMRLAYLRTEESGPLFESMKARLAGIASHTGMAGVFRLRGSDIYRVLEVERLPGPALPLPPPRYNAMSALRQISQRLAAAGDLRSLLDDALAALDEHMGIAHAMVLLTEAGAARAPRLYTVATRGYADSGVGSEIPFGQGVIGVAAAQATPIRISHFAAEYAYSRTTRDQWLASGDCSADALETEIPLPGLAEPQSQLAAPIVLGRRVVGVLYVESPQPACFSYDDEDALMAVATHLGATIAALQTASEAPDEARIDALMTPAPAATVASPAVIRRYRVNDSVFIDDDYLIKGVAGAIFWKLVNEFVAGRREEFTNRELRLDPALKLPDIADNLEARLILLQRRLAERCPFLTIEKTGRGRFRLRVERPLRIIEV
jgi:adenylate cyclase